jgi:tRNA A37 N6-isopentenylltransferase MiaA
MPEMAPFKEMLSAELTREVAAMIAQSDEKNMWRAQGAVRVLNKLQTLIESSNKAFEQQGPSLVGKDYLSSNSP